MQPLTSFTGVKSTSIGQLAPLNAEPASVEFNNKSTEHHIDVSIKSDVISECCDKTATSGGAGKQSALVEIVEYGLDDVTTTTAECSSERRSPTNLCTSKNAPAVPGANVATSRQPSSYYSAAHDLMMTNGSVRLLQNSSQQYYIKSGCYGPRAALSSPQVTDAVYPADVRGTSTTSSDGVMLGSSWYPGTAAATPQNCFYTALA